MAQFFEWLAIENGEALHDDLSRVTKADLVAYRRHLPPLGIAHDHLTDKGAVQGCAAQRLDQRHLAAKIVMPPKTHNEGTAFEPAEQRMI